MLEKSIETVTKNTRGSIMRLVVSIIILMLAGCGSIPTTDKITTEVKRYPMLGEVVSQELGDTLVYYLMASTAPSYRHVFGGKSSAVFIPEWEDERYEKFGIEGVFGGLCLDKTDMKFCSPDGFLNCNPFTCGLSKNNDPLHVYMPDTYVDYNQPYLRQELIYNGRIGDNVKFLYREFGRGYIRESFKQEIQYDLAEGMEIGFKGARIEILSATNRTLKYIVKSHFSDS